MPKIPNVHPKGGAWYYVKNKKWYRLCRIAEGESVLYAALARITNRVPETISMMVPAYLAEAEISPATRAKYQQQLTGILAHHLGHMRPVDVQPSHIAQYLQMRKTQGAGTAGNRERAALSSVFEFAMRKGWANHNPCRGVRRNKERPSRTYVTHEELSDVYARASTALQLLLNAAYLSGMRLGDLMALKRSALTDAGIEFVESKTGKRNLIVWQPALRSVIQDAISYGDAMAARVTKKLPHPRTPSEFVFINNRGWPWSQDGVSSAMRRAGATFGIRNLRSKAQTDSSNNVLGHTGQMRDRYTKVRRLTPVG